MKKRSLLIISVFMMAMLTKAAFTAEIKATSHKTFAIAPGGTVKLEGDEGFIMVESWDWPHVRLAWTKRIRMRSEREARKQFERVEVRIRQTGNRLHIKLVKPIQRRSFSFWDLLDPDTWISNRRSVIVDFELKVPREINLALINDEGDITVSSITGNVDIEVDEGDIEIEDIDSGHISLYADEGDINGYKLTNPDASITIDVDEGDVMLDNVITRRLNAECDEGDITIKKLTCSICNMATDEGDIELDIQLTENDRYHIFTDEGDIVFYLPPNPDVRLDVRSVEGAIRADFDVKIIKRGDWEECREVIGKRKSLIKAATDEGIIYIRKR